MYYKNIYYIHKHRERTSFSIGLSITKDFYIITIQLLLLLNKIQFKLYIDLFILN